MAKPTTLRGGQVTVELGKVPVGGGPIVYGQPCGLTSKSVTWAKGLEEQQIPDCDNPDAIDWIGRDAVSLSMSVSAEGVLAEESIETWLDAWHATDSQPVKINQLWPSKTITYTGFMHVENIEDTMPNGRRSTMNVSMQSDGELIRTTVPVTP